MALAAAVSPKNARGLMQVIPDTFNRMVDHMKRNRPDLYEKYGLEEFLICLIRKLMFWSEVII